MSETGIGTRGKWKLTLQVRKKEDDGIGPMELDQLRRFLTCLIKFWLELGRLKLVTCKTNSNEFEKALNIGKC